MTKKTKKPVVKSDVDVNSAEVDTVREMEASGDATDTVKHIPDSDTVEYTTNPPAGGQYRLVDGLYVPIKGE